MIKTKKERCGNMITIAIRGATTVAHNEKASILEATEELLLSIIKENKIGLEEISSILFTATKDLTKVYPAVAAREIGITNAALMCVQEMYVEGSLEMCVRVMVEIQRKSEDIGLHTKHIYLHGAAKLRPDLTQVSAIAIDGPAGAGKSTIAKNVANTLGYIYIDTGAMYRAVAYYCQTKEIDWNKEEDVLAVLDQIDIKIKIQDKTQHIYLNGKDISMQIRNQETASGASIVATYDKVRKQLVKLQRELASQTSVVMDGRDIGTHVLPNAKLKVFLTATVIERATRRARELEQNGHSVDLNEIKQEIMDRDYNDSNREFSPLCMADDAIEVDTTGQSIEEVTKEILNLISRLG